MAPISWGHGLWHHRQTLFHLFYSSFFFAIIILQRKERFHNDCFILIIRINNLGESRRLYKNKRFDLKLLKTHSVQLFYDKNHSLSGNSDGKIRPFSRFTNNFWSLKTGLVCNSFFGQKNRWSGKTGGPKHSESNAVKNARVRAEGERCIGQMVSQ